MIEVVKITIVLIFENKKEVGSSKNNNKRKSKKCYVLIKKRHIKSEKYVTPVDFAEHLRKSDLSENSKFITIDSYEIDSMKVIVILVKVDKMYNILRSAGMLLVCYWSRDKDEIG